MSFTPIDTCRSCGGGNLHPVVDLGTQPLANALRRPGDDSPEPRYPLALVCCGACSLVQLTGSVSPSELFDTYQYFSSFSTTMLDAMAALASRLIAERGLGPGTLVVELASNDGYLLTNYVERGIPVLGVDPAANVASVAIERGVPTLVAYFGEGVARQVVAEHGRAAVVHANNVLAHVPDVNDFVGGIATLLAPEGVAVIETPYLIRLIEHCEFDTIYHEHVFYYSLSALTALFSRHGLTIVDLEELPIHGGSLRLFVRSDRAEPSATVAGFLERERAVGVASAEYYADFADRVARLKDRTMALLGSLRAKGHRLAAYGAAAKGTVLCNHFGIGTDLVEFVVDRSPYKQGLLMPGVHLPIGPPELLLQERPDETLLLAWNFADEIVSQQAAYVLAGGRFIVPIPEPRMLPA